MNSDEENGNVVRLNVAFEMTTFGRDQGDAARVPPENVLNAALANNPDEVVVVSVKDGRVSLAFSNSVIADAMWAMDVARASVLYNSLSSVDDYSDG